MKKNTLIVGLVFLSAAGFISFSVSNNDSPHSALKSMGGPPYNTNAPGEKTCSGVEGASPCHSGGIPDNSGPASVSIISSGGMMYVPGQTYTITPTITHASRTRFGFQLTVLRTSNNANAGDIQITDTTNTWSQFPTYGSYQTREYALHKKPGTYFSSTTGSWSFKWQAPATNVGNIKMYACFNAANNNNTETGDECYFTTLTLTPSMTGLNEPKNLSAEINIFPNPAEEYFNLEIDADQSGDITVELYSLEGKKVQDLFRKNIVGGKLSENIYLDNRIQPGVYFIKTSLADRVSLKKLVVSGE
jgi:hypothetical protein